VKKSLNPLLLIGLIGTLTIGSTFFINLYRVFWADRDVWWTPQSMRLPLEDTGANFQLYISDRPLKTHLSEGTLYSSDSKRKQYRIISQNVTVRLNNWDKTRASILANTTISGVFFGASISLLIVGLIQAVSSKKNSP